MQQAATTAVQPWIGLNDVLLDGRFVFDRGTVALSDARAHFAAGRPNDARGEDCFMEDANGAWDDRSCPENRSVICGRF